LAGADANKADKNGLRPLLWAAYFGKDAVVEKLLAAGADANKANKNGETPLYLAAYNGKDAVVEKLLLAGADANKADKDGWHAAVPGRGQRRGRGR